MKIWYEEDEFGFFTCEQAASKKQDMEGGDLPRSDC